MANKLFKWVKNLTFIGATLALSFNACTPTGKKDADAVEALKTYIQKSFSVQSASDKKQMLELLTGEVKARLSSWSDEQFEGAFVQSKRKFLKLLIRENKKVSNQETSITYELTYLDQGKSSETKVTNRKLAVLVLEQDGWKIKEVKSIKELIEYQNEIALP